MLRNKLIYFSVGDRIKYDDDAGEVLDMQTSGRVASDDYLVLWDNGITSVVWGSDLVHEEASSL